MKEKNEKDQSAFILAEYSALRSEVDKRSDMRYRLVSYAVVLLGTMIALVSQSKAPNPSVLFIYPIFSLFFSALWKHNLIMSLRLSRYIQEKIETHFEHSGWESSNASASNLEDNWISNKLSVAGIFTLSSVTALLSGVLIGSAQTTSVWGSIMLFGGIEYFALAVGIASLILTIAIHYGATKYEEKIFARMAKSKCQ